MLSTYVPWAGRGLYHAIPAMTWDLGFQSLIDRTAPVSHLLQGPTITRILTENSNQKYVIKGLFLNLNKYCTNMPVWQTHCIRFLKAIVTWSQLNFWTSFIWYINVSRIHTDTGWCCWWCHGAPGVGVRNHAAGCHHCSIVGIIWIFQLEFPSPNDIWCQVWLKFKDWI